MDSNNEIDKRVNDIMEVSSLCGFDVLVRDNDNVILYFRGISYFSYFPVNNEIMPHNTMTVESLSSVSYKEKVKTLLINKIRELFPDSDMCTDRYTVSRRGTMYTVYDGMNGSNVFNSINISSAYKKANYLQSQWESVFKQK